MFPKTCIRYLTKLRSVVLHILYTRTPLCLLDIDRLACIKFIASIHSEPGSNSVVSSIFTANYWKKNMDPILEFLSNDKQKNYIKYKDWIHLLELNIINRNPACSKNSLTIITNSKIIWKRHLESKQTLKLIADPNCFYDIRQ